MRGAPRVRTHRTRRPDAARLPAAGTEPRRSRRPQVRPKATESRAYTRAQPRALTSRQICNSDLFDDLGGAPRTGRASGATASGAARGERNHVFLAGRATQGAQGRAAALEHPRPPCSAGTLQMWKQFPTFRVVGHCILASLRGLWVGRGTLRGHTAPILAPPQRQQPCRPPPPPSPEPPSCLVA